MESTRKEWIVHRRDVPSHMVDLGVGQLSRAPTFTVIDMNFSK